MELPFNFAPKTTAKAAQVMANFNALKNVVGAIEAVLTGGVGKTQLAPGFKQKRVTGTFNAQLNAGDNHSAQGLVAHGLGEIPAHIDGTVWLATGYDVNLEFRVQEADGVNFLYNVHASTAIPGEPGTFIIVKVTWEAVGP